RSGSSGESPSLLNSPQRGSGKAPPGEKGEEKPGMFGRVNVSLFVMRRRGLRWSPSPNALGFFSPLTPLRGEGVHHRHAPCLRDSVTAALPVGRLTISRRDPSKNGFRRHSPCCCSQRPDFRSSCSRFTMRSCVAASTKLHADCERRTAGSRNFSDPA